MTDQTTVREQLLNAIDFSYCQTLGYGTPEGLLAAYEASRTQTVDDSAVEALSDTLYDALYAITPFAEKYFADEGEGLRNAVRAVLEQAAVLPATTNHDTDAAPAATCSAQYHGPGEDRARLCIRAAQHQRTAHTDEHGFHWSDTVAMYPVADGTFRIGTDVRAELRRVADETAATETPWPTQQRWRIELFDYLAEEWSPGGTRWPTREQAMERIQLMREKAPMWKDGPPVERRVVRETTTYTVEAEPAAGARQDGAQPGGAA